MSLKLSTILSLLKKYTRDRATLHESRYLIRRLRTLPLLSTIPEEVFEDVARLLDVKSLPRGVEVFREYEAAHLPTTHRFVLAPQLRGNAHTAEIGMI